MLPYLSAYCSLIGYTGRHTENDRRGPQSSRPPRKSRHGSQTYCATSPHHTSGFTSLFEICAFGQCEIRCPTYQVMQVGRASAATRSSQTTDGGVCVCMCLLVCYCVSVLVC